MLTLTERLKIAADFVKPCRKTVDVGTDHGYLPAFLVINGITDSCIACDIGIQPLENAAKTFDVYSLGESIELRLSDGLKNIAPQEAEEIIICGMGGTLIRDILSDCEWVTNKNVHLILQPMTHIEDVREYLISSGFIIDREKCVKEQNHVYCVMSAYYDGHISERSAGYIYFGDILKDKSDAAAEFNKKQLKRAETRLAALKNNNIKPDECERLAEILEYYEREKTV